MMDTVAKPRTLRLSESWEAWKVVMRARSVAGYLLLGAAAKVVIKRNLNSCDVQQKLESHHNPPQPSRASQHPASRNRIPPLPTLPPSLSTPLLFPILPLLQSQHKRLLLRMRAIDPPENARVAVHPSRLCGGGGLDFGEADGTERGGVFFREILRGGRDGGGDGEDGEVG